MIESHFVYLCPVRRKMSICVVDSKGRFYTAPAWCEEGEIESRGRDGTTSVEIIESRQALGIYKSMEWVIDNRVAVSMGRDVERHSMLQIGGDEFNPDEYMAWVRAFDIAMQRDNAHFASVRAGKLAHKRGIKNKERRAKRRSKMKEALNA